MVNLALGSSKKVLRLRGTNFVLERSSFDEVWMPKEASDAAPSGGADFGQHGWVPRVRHWTHALDSLGWIRSYTHRGLQLTRAPDSPRSVRSHTQGGLKVSLTPDDGTGLTEGASGVLLEKVQLAINGAPDALCSASGATLSASGAPIFSGKWLAGPWT